MIFQTWLFGLTEFIVWNIKGLQHRVAKIYRFKNSVSLFLFPFLHDDIDRYLCNQIFKNVLGKVTFSKFLSQLLNILSDTKNLNCSMLPSMHVLHNLFDTKYFVVGFPVILSSILVLVWSVSGLEQYPWRFRRTRTIG